MGNIIIWIGNCVFAFLCGRYIGRKEILKFVTDTLEKRLTQQNKEKDNQ